MAQYDYRQIASDAESRYRLPRGILSAIIEATSKGNPAYEDAATGHRGILPQPVGATDVFASIDSGAALLRQSIAGLGNVRDATAQFLFGRFSNLSKTENEKLASVLSQLPIEAGGVSIVQKPATLQKGIVPALMWGTALLLIILVVLKVK